MCASGRLNKGLIALIIFIILALVVGPGCKDKKNAKKPAPAAEKKVALLKVDESLGDFQADALIVAGISSLKELKVFLDTASKAVDDPVDFDTVVLPNLLNELGLSGPSGIDLDRPVYLIGWNPKKIKNTSLLLPITDRAAFEAALGEKKVESKEGSDYVIKTDFRDLHALHLENYVALSQDLPPISENKVFLEKIHKSFMPKETLHALVSMKNFNRVYEQELKEGRDELMRELTTNLNNSGVLGGPNAASIPPTMISAYASEIDEVVDFMKSVNTIDLRSTVSQERMIISMLADSPVGSKLDTFLKEASKRDQSLIQSLPASTSLVAAQFMGKRALKTVEEQGIDTLLAALDLSPEEKATLKKSVSEALKNITGDSLFALYHQAPLPVSLMGITVVNDGTKLKKVLQDVSNIIRTKAQKYMLSQGGGPQLDFSSWATAITQLDQTVRPFGVGLELVEQSNLVALRIKGNYDASPFIPPNIKPILKKHVGSKLEIALGIEQKDKPGDAAMVVAFGPTAIDDTVSTLSRNKTFTNAAYTKAQARGAKNSFMNLWLDLGTTLRAFAPIVRELGPMAGEDAATTQKLATGFESFPTGIPFTFSGGGENAHAHVVVDLPFAPLKALRSMGK